MLYIYTDGSANVEDGNGGWAFTYHNNGELVEVNGSERNTTNNRMELMAVIQAIKQAPLDTPIKIHSDSQYVVKGCTEWIFGWQRKGWRKADKSPLLNADLWKDLWVLLQSRNDIQFEWVKAHANCEMNIIADQLANAARLAITE